MRVSFFAACDTAYCFREHSTLFKASLVTFRVAKVVCNNTHTVFAINIHYCMQLALLLLQVFPQQILATTLAVLAKSIVFRLTGWFLSVRNYCDSNPTLQHFIVMFMIHQVDIQLPAGNVAIMWSAGKVGVHMSAGNVCFQLSAAKGDIQLSAWKDNVQLSAGKFGVQLSAGKVGIHLFSRKNTVQLSVLKVDIQLSAWKGATELSAGKVVG